MAGAMKNWANRSRVPSKWHASTAQKYMVSVSDVKALDAPAKQP